VKGKGERKYKVSCPYSFVFCSCIVIALREKRKGDIETPDKSFPYSSVYHPVKELL